MLRISTRPHQLRVGRRLARLTRLAALAAAVVLVGTGLPSPGDSARAESVTTGTFLNGAMSLGAFPATAAVGRAAVVPVSSGQSSQAGRSVGTAMYGRPASGLAWHTGFWAGTTMSTTRMRQAQAWAGHPFDFATTYPGYASWNDMVDSDWAAGLFDGFGGRLSYGLPLLPVNRRGQWADVTSGAHDAVFRTIARQLVAHGRGDSAVRVGLEANGDWFPWAVTATTAPQFRAAFRRVVTVMRSVAPKLTFWFDTSAGFGLGGQSHRLDTLNVLYPGDAYVDGISMDHYDFYQLAATSEAAWRLALRPVQGPGLQDAVTFARAHHKGFAVPEWGVHKTRGPGDNPFFIRKMHDFFVANRDVLVYECYFNEPDPYIRNAIWGPVEMPRSSAAYRALFRA